MSVTTKTSTCPLYTVTPTVVGILDIVPCQEPMYESSWWHFLLHRLDKYLTQECNVWYAKQLVYICRPALLKRLGYDFPIVEFGGWNRRVSACASVFSLASLTNAHTYNVIPSTVLFRPPAELSNSTFLATHCACLVLITTKMFYQTSHS